MENIKTILVVEDKVEEQEKALTALKIALNATHDEEIWFRISPTRRQVMLKESGTLIFLVPNLVLADEKLGMLKMFGESGAMQGVMTDLMFPKSAEAKEKPHGLSVIVSCIHSGVPVVMCSDTDHHDVDYLRTVFPILSSAHPKGEIPVILDNKDWTKAATSVLGLMVTPE